MCIEVVETPPEAPAEPTMLEEIDRIIARHEDGVVRAKEMRQRIIQHQVGHLPRSYFELYGF